MIPIIRIGLSVLNAENKISVCRKGLPKIFELPKKFLNLNEESTGNTHNINNIILDRIKKQIENKSENSKNKEISIYKILKLNGIETHVSYIEKIDSWLIGIKNFSIVFKDRAELESNHKNKYILDIYLL